MTELIGPLAPGELYEGRYRILGVAGRSNHGFIYDAEAEGVDHHVALKLLPIETDQPRNLAHAQTLTEGLAQLQHPKLVPLLDIGISQNRQYVHVVMDWVKGQTLHSCLGACGEYEVTTALNVIIQICDGLHYAHQKRVFHGDLTPRQVLVGRGEQVRILGIGMTELAAYISALAPPLGTVAGTPKYLAPEQLLGEPLDAASDVFSAGLLLYEMLARRAPDLDPSASVSLDQFVAIRLRGPNARLDHCAKGVPEALATLALQAIAKDREQRLGSLAELGAQCRAILAKLREADPPLLPRSRAPKKVVPAAASASEGEPSVRRSDGKVKPTDITVLAPPQSAPQGAPSVPRLPAQAAPSVPRLPVQAAPSVPRLPVQAAPSVPRLPVQDDAGSSVNAEFPRIPAPSFVTEPTSRSLSPAEVEARNPLDQLAAAGDPPPSSRRRLQILVAVGGLGLCAVLFLIQSASVSQGVIGERSPPAYVMGAHPAKAATEFPQLAPGLPARNAVPRGMPLPASSRRSHGKATASSDTGIPLGKAAPVSSAVKKKHKNTGSIPPP